MKCPHCSHVSDKALLRCSQCSQVYDRDSLEALQHLDYLMLWLARPADEAEQPLLRKLRADAVRQRDTLRGTLGLLPLVDAGPAVSPQASARAPAEGLATASQLVTAPAELAAAATQPAAVPAAAVSPFSAAVREATLLAAVRRHSQTWSGAMAGIKPDVVSRLQQQMESEAQYLQGETSAAELPVETLSMAEIMEFAIDALPDWATAAELKVNDVDTILRYLRAWRQYAANTASSTGLPTEASGARAATATPSVASGSGARATARPVAAAPAPKAPRPPINWRAWWDRSWQLVVSGALLRGLLYLGAFMIVISAAVLAVAFRDSFPLPVQLTFIAAVPVAFYLAGYFLRTRLQSPIAGGVFTGIGALLVAVDFAAVYQLGGLATLVDGNAYWLAASLLCATIYTITARRAPSEFHGYIMLLGMSSAIVALSRVARLPLEWNLAALAAAAAAMAYGGAVLRRRGPQWRDLARAAQRWPLILVPLSQALVLFVGGDAAPGQAATFLFAALAYGLMAWHNPSVVLAQAAAWSPLAALYFVFRAVALPSEWYASLTAFASSAYIAVGRQIERGLPLDFPPRRTYLRTAYWVAAGLLLLATLGGFLAVAVNLWAGALALTLVALILAVCAYLFKRSLLLLGAGVLFTAPVTIAVLHWLVDFGAAQPLAWLCVVWSAQALAYLFAALRLRAAEGYARSLFACTLLLLAPAALLPLALNYALYSLPWMVWPIAAALGAAIVVYGALAIVSDRGHDPALAWLVGWLPKALFIWPVALLLPFWLATVWAVAGFDRTSLPPALAVLALLYVGVGQGLARRRTEYRLPAHAAAYLIGIAAIAAGLPGSTPPLALTVYIVVAMLAALGFCYKRPGEVALAGFLFLWPFQLTLNLSPLLQHVYALPYVLLAAAYVTLGIRLGPAGRSFRDPLLIAGYGLSATALAVAVLGDFGVFGPVVAWAGSLAALLVAALHVHAALHFRKSPFAWFATFSGAAAYAGMLAMLPVPRAYTGLAWLVLAYGYLLGERILARSAPPAARQLFQRTLTAATTAICAFGLIASTLLFIYAQPADALPPILSYTLATLLAILGARAHRSKWPLFIEPWLALVAVTWFCASYTQRILGTVLAPPQYALVWAALGVMHLGAAAWLDRRTVRYAHGLYLGGYALAAAALYQSSSDRGVNLVVLGICIVLALLSQALVYAGRHQTVQEFIASLRLKTGGRAERAARTLFLFLAAYAFPIWLMQLFAQLDVAAAWRGAGLALAAPIYIALGLLARRFRAEYRWPLYSAGYALTAIGAWLAFGDERVLIAVLALDAAVYAASAYIFQRSVWLYLSNTLAPAIALLILHVNGALNAPAVAIAWMAMAFAYFGAGLWFDRARTHADGRVASSTRRLDKLVAPFALPFLATGYALSVFALVIASGEKLPALQLTSAGVVLYALSAWRLRARPFLYAAAWLAPVPYYLALTLLPIPVEWLGLGWLPMIIVYLAAGWSAARQSPLDARAVPGSLAHAAMPFLLAGYALSVLMVVQASGAPLPATLAMAAAALLYFASARLFAHAAWLYPALLSTHLALLTALRLLPPGYSLDQLALPFHVLTWASALAAYAVERRAAPGGTLAERAGLTGILESFGVANRKPGIPTAGAWARPLYLCAAIDVVLWQLVALGGVETTLVVAAGHALLLALFAIWWRNTPLAYGSVGFGVLAGAAVAQRIGLGYIETMALLAGFGLLLYLSSALVRRGARASAPMWAGVLARSGLALGTLALLGVTPVAWARAGAAALALALAGALYIAAGLREGRRSVSYIGTAMIEVAWIVLLTTRAVAEPQWYAIPGGLYLLAVAYFERRLAGRSPGARSQVFATAVEGLGLAVLLLTPFVQSLSLTAGLSYFLLLLCEALLLIGWGASQRSRVSFFAGFFASVLNVLAQLVVLMNGLLQNVRNIEPWLAVIGAGVLVIILAVLIERQKWLERVQGWQ